MTKHNADASITFPILQVLQVIFRYLSQSFEDSDSNQVLGAPLGGDRGEQGEDGRDHGPEAQEPLAPDLFGEISAYKSRGNKV